MHKHITQPALTEGDAIAKAAHDLTAAIKGRQNWLGDEQKHDLQQLSNIFNEIATTKRQPQEQLADKETHPNLRAAQEQAMKRYSPAKVPTPRVERSEPKERVGNGTSTHSTKEEAPYPELTLCNSLQKWRA